MRLWSWTGFVLAALYAAGYAALYVDYLGRAGTWMADLLLALSALPFTLTMRTLNGGSYDFSGDMTARVLAAGLFCSALAYGIGLVAETLVRAIVRVARGAKKAGG